MAWMNGRSPVRQNRPSVIVDRDQLMKLFTALGAHSLPAQTFYLLCIALGCPFQAVAAMQWTDVDLARGVWRPTTVGEPLVLPAFLVRRLQDLHRERTGPAVFVPQRGLMAWAPSHADWDWGRVCRRAGLDRITLHDVRHTWPRLEAETQAELEGILVEITASRHHHAAPPVPVNSVRVVPLAPGKRIVVRRVDAQPCRRQSNGRDDRWKNRRPPRSDLIRGYRVYFAGGKDTADQGQHGTYRPLRLTDETLPTEDGAVFATRLTHPVEHALDIVVSTAGSTESVTGHFGPKSALDGMQ